MNKFVWFSVKIVGFGASLLVTNLNGIIAHIKRPGLTCLVGLTGLVLWTANLTTPAPLPLVLSSFAVTVKKDRITTTQTNHAEFLRARLARPSSKPHLIHRKPRLHEVQTVNNFSLTRHRAFCHAQVRLSKSL